MKAVNTRDPVTQVPPIYLVTMLEYVILTGYDWWDIIAALKPGMISVVRTCKLVSFLEEETVPMRRGLILSFLIFSRNQEIKSDHQYVINIKDGRKFPLMIHLTSLCYVLMTSFITSFVSRDVDVCCFFLVAPPHEWSDLPCTSFTSPDALEATVSITTVASRACLLPSATEQRLCIFASRAMIHLIGKIASRVVKEVHGNPVTAVSVLLVGWLLVC